MRVDLLGAEDVESLARFLLHRMSQKTRGKLIVERPMIYRQLLGRSKKEPAFRDTIRTLVIGWEGNPDE